LFVWLLHQPASAAWLKRELAARRPDLRLAFSRPGLTTFKTDSTAPIEGSFARAWGQSLGRADDVAAIAPLLSELDGPLRLHVFERDLDLPADERSSVAGSRARTLEAEIRARYAARFAPGVEAHAGDRILDVIAAPAERDAEPLFVGWHVHDDTRGPWPGGVPHVAIPAEAPSRAWAKLEEAIRWSQLVPRSGETAVELGSAPGGSSYALLERGLTVHGIDPGAMAASVLDNRRFVHHAKPAAEVERRDLPRTFEWLACDTNLAPMFALKYVERFVALAHGGLRGAFVTLKINDDGIFEALPKLRARIERLGGKRVRVTQLPSHRSEVVAIVTF
jgi:23S rRNA (cytidine2498-2'-O)-methyltransferase